MEIAISLSVVIVLLAIVLYWFACECDHQSRGAATYRLKYHQSLEMLSDKEDEIHDLEKENESLKRVIKNAQSLLCSAAIGEQGEQSEHQSYNKYEQVNYSPLTYVTASSGSQDATSEQIRSTERMPPPPPQGEPMTYV